MEMYIGKKLYYLGFGYGYFGVIYAKIVDIQKENIFVQDEHGRKFTIKAHWVNEFGKIVTPKGEQTKPKENYLKCRCGSLRFSYNDQKLCCNDCGSEYSNDELELLEKAEYVGLVDKKENIILN